VTLLALPETTPAALFGLYEVFSAVGVMWRELTGEAVTARRLETRIASRGSKPFASPVGAMITPHAAVADVAHSDIVVVTDLAFPPDSDPRGRWPAEAEWIRRQWEQGTTVCSICTGSIFLAEAGLLDGREATTHWVVTDLFRRCYPAVRLRPERILCPGGPEHRVVTAGGASSWEDLALYLIARFSGEAEALRMAKLFVLGDRSEGQLPFAAMGRPRQHDDAAVGACQVWIADHYAEPNPVTRMVAQSGLATRTFKRRFKAATGYAPVDYVQALRIEEAKQLLETTDKPTDSIAHAVGYEDPAFFRRLFKRRTGVTPAKYRNRFQAITRLRPTA
jgi:transcriptional regulator GlxA family with amidase domain